MDQYSTNTLEEEEIIADKSKKKKNFRQQAILAQVLAVCSVNLILLDLGMILALPTIVISDLLKSKDFNFSTEQASWFGSLAFFSQPLGSALSGILFESVGRRTSVLYVNYPLFVGWLLMSFGNSIIHFYIAQIIMGMSIGLMDAPHITYLGEITQPRYRAVLISFAELCVAFGFCFVYFLSLITDWRTVSMICCLVPMLSVVFISRIPESPVWLLNNGKAEASLKSLCWLRGWVDPSVVQDEFTNLKKESHKNIELEENNSLKHSSCKQTKRWSFFNKYFNFTGIKSITQKSVLRPLIIIATYFGFSHIAGVTNTRPFMVEIFNEFGTTSVSAFTITAVSSVISIIGLVTGMILIPKTGKRILSIISMFGCALFSGSISLYGLTKVYYDAIWIPSFLFLMLIFCWNFGIGQIPWMLISEMFPFQGRGFASGIVAAISYLEAFVFIKTYFWLYNALSISGVFAFFSLCSFIGSFFIFYFLPETEGKTLEQITSVSEIRQRSYSI